MTRSAIRAGVLAVPLLLAGCGAPPWKPAPFEPAAAPRSGAAPATDAQRKAQPVIPTPVPQVLPVQPQIGAGSSEREPFLYQPGPTAPTPAPPAPVYQGPITGYGPGGMGYPPGAPPNPPYYPGGVPH